MKKWPVVGLIPLYDDEKESYWMLPGYMQVLEKHGALPLMLPLTDSKEELLAAFELCDGLLLTGGHDVSPDVYGVTRSERCGSSCELRDKMEGILLSEALKEDKPVLGICRGIQFMNAFLGGTLYQDLQTEFESDVEHHMSPPYDREAHKVAVLGETRLAEIIGVGLHGVNSYHHQAVKELAPNLEVMAISEDGLIEAIEVSGKRFAIGIQWHPEFFYKKDEDSNKIIAAFVSSCAENCADYCADSKSL